MELRKTKFFTTNVGMWRFGQILGFDFRRRGPYDLLFRALAETIGKRNIKAERIFEQTIEHLEMENPKPHPLDEQLSTALKAFT